MEEPIVILVVEDDQAIQGFIEETLSDGGFEPAIASTGEEAITVLNGGAAAYRLLILDIKLGKDRVRGWDVARRARAINPALPVLYITGGHADEWFEQGVPNSFLLAKPFAPAQLVTAVAQLLNDAQATR
jgi:DNA-binding response OmpR family regulator